MRDAAAAGLRLRPGDGTRWRSRSFGLDLDLGFPSPALPAAQSPVAGGEITTVELVYADSLDAAWPEGSRRTGLMGPAERPEMVVHEHPAAGYRIELPPYGRYLVSADGLSIACAPPAVAWWYWQRLLIGQVLPAAAALRGYEVLHASAVSLRGRAIAFAGEPGAGKSSLALRLMERGAGLIAEDVLALEEREGRLIAEPGAAMLNLRDDEWTRQAASGAAGREVGRSHGKVHVIVPRESEPRELAALYLLERAEAGAPTFEPLGAPSARDVMANSFVQYVLRAERLVRQLDVASALARTVKLVRLRLTPGVGADELANRVQEHAEALA